jgi:hypothetical protein
MAGGFKQQQSFRGITQDSPFLKLPGEVRTLIYRAALTRSTPLDLYPHKFIPCPESSDELNDRLSKPKNLGPKPRDWHRTINVRDQHDLAHIRTEMATGFLATCKQVQKEATMIFWRENTFRFSGDCEWEGIRRFLTTIGTEARKRIRLLELTMPLALEPRINMNNPASYDRLAKNHPKLHMAKLLPFDRKVDRKKANIEFVLSMMRLEGFLREIRLIVSSGWNCTRLPDPVIDSSLWAGHTELAGLGELQRSIPVQLTIVLESKSSMSGAQNFATLKYWGIGVVAHSGCLIERQLRRMTDSSNPFEEVTELSVWPAERELDIITGMELLFDDSGKMGLPARGGKATKHQGKKKAERVLKGFGGCRFVRRLGYYCTDWDCGQPIANPDKNINQYGFYCGSCKSLSFEWKDEVGVRKMARERRRNW